MKSSIGLRDRVWRLLNTDNQDGQGMVEYGLILVLIAVVVIVALVLLGNQVVNVFCNISTGLGA
jgi:pilus assembly protein Flp/PilA